VRALTATHWPRLSTDMVLVHPCRRNGRAPLRRNEPSRRKAGWRKAHVATALAESIHCHNELALHISSEKHVPTNQLYRPIQPRLGARPPGHHTYITYSISRKENKISLPTQPVPTGKLRQIMFFKTKHVVIPFSELCYGPYGPTNRIIVKILCLMKRRRWRSQRC
jgi:hypothetical protein